MKSKTYKNTTAADRKSYLGYLNKLADEYSNTCHRSIGQRLIYAAHSALTEKIKISPKAPKFKVGDSVRIIKYKNICSIRYTESWSKKVFLIDPVVKNNP